MVKYEKSIPKNEEKRNKTMVVNLGKVSGIGGVIFVGGVLVTGIVASVIAMKKKKNHKSIYDKNNNPRTSASLPSPNSEEESKGLQCLVSDSCSKENPQLSNGKTVTALRKASSFTCLISTENLCKDSQNESNHEEKSKSDYLKALEDRKVQMGKGEKPSSSLAHVDNHAVSIAQSSIFNRNQHHDDSDISTRTEIDETFDTRSAEVTIVGDNLIEKTNNTYENDDESHEIREEVEDKSEGTMDLSAESNSETIWPTETTIQKISMAHKAGPDIDIKENKIVEVPIKQMNHNEIMSAEATTVGIRNGSRMRFVSRYNLHLDSMKWRILLGTLLAFLLYLCFGGMFLPA